MSAHIPTEDKAIEVAALLGESVVDVKHCMDPKSGTITSKTWALFATGIVAVLGSAVAFYVSVSTAAYNKAALEYWTQVANKPAHAYRPQLVSAGLDWLAFGGFAIGLTALAYALLRMRREKQSPYYRVGTAAGVEQPVEGAPAPDFPLIAPTSAGDDFVFNFSSGMTGELVVDGQPTPLRDLVVSGRAQPSLTVPGAYAVPIPAHAKIKTTIGQTSFLVRAVGKPRRHAAPLLAGLERRTVSYFAGSLGVHLGIVLLLAQIPVESGAAAVDLTLEEPTGIDTSGVETETTPPEQLSELDKGAGPEGAGAAMELEEGAAGTTKSTRKDGHLRIKDNGLPPQLARQQAIEEARTAGFLGSASALTGSTFASITEHGNLSSGPDGVDTWGPLFGAEGEGAGTFGYGRTGWGRGGGCPPGAKCGIIGTEPGYGRIGLGKYPGSGWDGPGGGGIGRRNHRPLTPVATIGQPTGVGDLDKATIRRYIRRSYDKIAYCYERELLARPGISGDVMVQFFISPSGSVRSSVGSGFDGKVANCVAEVVGAIQFPKPSGGGGVQVNYPFKFHAAGQ